MTITSAADLRVSQLAPEDLSEETRALLYDELYRDYGVSRDQDWLNAADGGRFFVARNQRGLVCGAGRLMPAGPATLEHGLQIRQLATTASEQGQGVGSAVMDAIEAEILERDVSRAWLKARKQAWDFYLKRGYQFEGPEFSAGECLAQDGLFVSKLTGIPHKIMAKRL